MQKDCGVLGRKKKKNGGVREAKRGARVDGALPSALGALTVFRSWPDEQTKHIEVYTFFSLSLFLSTALLIYHPRVPLRVWSTVQKSGCHLLHVIHSFCFDAVFVNLPQ